MNRLVLLWKALTQLGIEPVALNALYKFGLASGHYRRLTSRSPQVSPGELQTILPIPERTALLALLGADGRAALLAEADEITAGKVRLFGQDPVRLDLSARLPLRHWTEYEQHPELLSPYFAGIPDVKFIWEPARFGWVFPLGRAYVLSGDDRYAAAFWQQVETFLDAHPPYQGPHWMSAQEVAFRLMAWVWAAGVFAASPVSTPGRRARLAASLAAHAARIPPTLVYARSQQNNHLPAEAAGLITAGLALPDHPSALRWQALGWRWLNNALQTQIDAYGEYIQHSTNYQRLMLQLVLWVNALLESAGLGWSRPTMEAVRRSVHWLLAMLDPDSGSAPNLGANDGALLFPCSIQPFADFRPVAYAAARLFLEYDLPAGAWDEQALWFNARSADPRVLSLPRYLGDQLNNQHSWACLRTAQYTSRPSHADQLHVDLWWRGLNVACDPGTYLYNAPPPWENSLTSALLHNTISVDGRDQMTPAGRFLYLDWLDAYRREEIMADPQILQRVHAACRSAHGRFRHTRTVDSLVADRWRIRDEVLLQPAPRLRPRQRDVRLHWCFPDWKWELQPLSAGAGAELRLQSPYGWIRVLVSQEGADTGDPQAFVTLARAGTLLHGEGRIPPQEGWISPTYALKLPALSFALTARGAASAVFTTEIIFPQVGRLE